MLVDIEIAGPGSKARRLVFDDGLDPRCTSAVAVKQLGLEAGAPVSREEVEDSLGAIEYGLAKERALRLLGYREHSRAELRRKLRETGYPAAVADAVTARFAEVELLDDRRFASAWTRSRLSAGYGARRIEQELAQRGIEAEIVEETLKELSHPHDELRRARAALGGRRATDRASRDRLVRRLVARGFSLTVAIGALDEEGPDEAVE